MRPLPAVVETAHRATGPVGSQCQAIILANRFVRIKSAEQQGQLMQHRTRHVLIRQRTQIINALRA